MTTDNIKHDLEQLQRQLQEIDASAGATPAEIQHLLAQVNEALEKFEEEQQRNLLEQLQASIEQFQAEHPQLINQIDKLIWNLTNAGL